jgi:lysophospholipase L1-like esterase
MPLGDSITKGVDGPSTDDAGYRNDLADSLNSEGIGFDFVGSLVDGSGFDADHEGHAGWRADQIINGRVGQSSQGRLTTWLPDYDPRVVLLHIGTNDVDEPQDNDSTIREIGNIIDRIDFYNSDIVIVLASLIGRIDDYDEKTDELNLKIADLFLEKRLAGRKIFYAGIAEVCKSNPAWVVDYFAPFDIKHPNDAGFAVMAQVWLNTLTTALNAGARTNVSDNFQRTRLGISWVADEPFEIRDGDLVNAATTGSRLWQHMAIYIAKTNPTDVSLTWADDALSSGIRQGGLALLLNSPAQNANGYLAYIETSNNTIHLWTIVNGQQGSNLDLSRQSSAKVPGAGDTFRVKLRGNPKEIYFDYFVNDEAAGTITIPNDGSQPSTFYSGVLLRHSRDNDVADFTAEGHGDFVAPGTIEDLTVSDISATSAWLGWIATGDDGETGRATRYRIRYSEDEFSDEQVWNNSAEIPTDTRPQLAGAMETAAVLELGPAKTWHIAVRAEDETGNLSPLSGSVQVTTPPGRLFVDRFGRDELGADWLSDSLAIENEELVSLSRVQGKWELGIVTSEPNPIEVSFKWSDSTDALGRDQSGIAVMFDAANLNASGYLITRRTVANEFRLWRIVEGGNPTAPLSFVPALPMPQAGDELRIRISSDQSGNHFTIFINGKRDTTLTDPDFFIDPATEQLYSGVMLPGGRKNNIDDFKVVIAEDPVSVSDDYLLPTAFFLSPNYPNPFNPATTMSFTIASPSHTTLTLFNVQGQVVRKLVDDRRERGTYSVVWDGRDAMGRLVSSGVYLVRMEAADFRAARTVVLAR